MRRGLIVLTALLGLIVCALPAWAVDNPLTGEWTGSITPKSGGSVSTTVSLKPTGALTLFVRGNKGSYVYSGTWSFAKGQLRLDFSSISPRSTVDPFWPAGDREFGYVQFDKKKVNKIFVRFTGDPWGMTLFKQ